MIEIKPHIAINIATRKEQTYDEQIIYLDDLNMGKIGNKPGSKIAWFRKVDDDTRAEIESFVADKVGWPVANSHMPPDLTSLKEDTDDDLDD